MPRHLVSAFYPRGPHALALTLALSCVSCANSCKEPRPSAAGTEPTPSAAIAPAAPPKPVIDPNSPLASFDQKLEALKTDAAGRDAQYKQAVLRAMPGLQRARAEARMALDKIGAASDAEKQALQATADAALARAEAALDEVEAKLKAL